MVVQEFNRRLTLGQGPAIDIPVNIPNKEGREEEFLTRGTGGQLSMLT